MQAVANVIDNRTKQNFSGYGANYVSQAYARNQFQGQARPGEAALAMARRLQNGDLPDITGGATFYARPENSTARWATRLTDDNAYRIGHHLFTNNQEGIPFRGPPSGPPTPPHTPTPQTSGNYLADRQKLKDDERIAASHTAEAHRGTPAGQGRHLAHLHEIHDHLSHLHARIADLEARHERQHRKGVVTDVDNKKHLARIEIGRDCDGSNQVKSPWLPWAQISGGKQGLNVHSPVTVGEQVMLVNPDGSPDFTQALVVRHGWYDKNPSPSTDPSADVTVRGTTINVRSMTTIAHSIGGSLSGPLMSIISGGITRLIDKLGHHISAPGATVDSSAQTHTHDSSDTHTDTSMNDMTHMSQNKNIVQKATNGSHQTIAKTVTHSASQSMSFSAPSTLVSIV